MIQCTFTERVQIRRWETSFSSRLWGMGMSRKFTWWTLQLHGHVWADSKLWQQVDSDWWTVEPGVAWATATNSNVHVYDMPIRIIAHCKLTQTFTCTMYLAAGPESRLSACWAERTQRSWITSHLPVLVVTIMSENVLVSFTEQELSLPVQIRAAQILARGNSLDRNIDNHDDNTSCSPAVPVHWQMLVAMHGPRENHGNSCTQCSCNSTVGSRGSTSIAPSVDWWKRSDHSAFAVEGLSLTLSSFVVLSRSRTNACSCAI